MPELNIEDRVILAATNIPDIYLCVSIIPERFFLFSAMMNNQTIAGRTIDVRLF